MPEGKPFTFHTWKKDVLPDTDMCVHCGLLRRWGEEKIHKAWAGGSFRPLEYYGTINGEQVMRRRARDFQCSEAAN